MAGTPPKKNAAYQFQAIDGANYHIIATGGTVV